MTTDPFTESNRANDRAAVRKAAQEAAERRQAEAKAVMEAAKKPKFNDLPPFKPKWSI